MKIIVDSQTQSSLIDDSLLRFKTLLLFPTPMASLWKMMMVSSSCLEMRGNTRGENREQLAMIMMCGDHNNVTSGVRDWIMCQCALCRQTAGQWQVLACQWAQWWQCSPDQATASEYWNINWCKNGGTRQRQQLAPSWNEQQISLTCSELKT